MVNFPSGISEMTITGDQAGGSFVLDDATYTTAPPATAAPEPSYLPVFAAIFLVSGVVFGVRSLGRK